MESENNLKSLKKKTRIKKALKNIFRVWDTRRTGQVSEKLFFAKLDSAKVVLSEADANKIRTAMVVDDYVRYLSAVNMLEMREDNGKEIWSLRDAPLP